MKENAVGVGGAAHAWCLLGGHVTRSGNEAEGPLQTAAHEQVRQIACACVVFMCVCDVVGRAGGSYWVQVCCESLRWWGWGYKMWTWTGKIRGFDESQGQLWLWSISVSMYTWHVPIYLYIYIYLSACLSDFNVNYNFASRDPKNRIIKGKLFLCRISRRAGVTSTGCNWNFNWY